MVVSAVDVYWQHGFVGRLIGDGWMMDVQWYCDTRETGLLCCSIVLRLLYDATI